MTNASTLEGVLEKPKILIVDDRPENLYVLDKLLKMLDIQVIQAQSGAEALELVLEHEFFAAIVDIQMPEMDGYELVELLRSSANTASLPVLFMSAIYSDEYHHRKAYETGAVDFLSKPFIPEILISKIKVFLDLYQQRKALEQANQATQRANEAILRASADKDKFFSIISHDLRAPFNVVLGFAQLLEIQAQMLSGNEVEEMAHSIYNGAKEAYTLLDNLLTWARLQRDKGMTLEQSQINLSSLTQDSIKVLEQAAESKEISLKSLVSPDLAVYADRRMIDTVIRNLVSNALKFTPRGGSVTVSAAENGSPGYVSIAVQDTGIGMEPETMAKLFKIGTHNSRPGTEKETGSGLGLIICQEMVERHGGRIWVESEAGRGTTMHFTVPCASQPQANKA